MILGCIADDFTGASDIANLLAKSGARTIQFAGIPSASVPADCEAGVISLKTRTAPVRDAVEQSLAALSFLVAQNCHQIVFKYCSTFDSTMIGNIGPVAEALANELGARSVVVCPAFPATGRTVYQGHLFVKDRLLSESGMQDHPLTPMSDPDIRRWLRHQTTGPVGHVPYEIVVQGCDAIRSALDQAKETLVVVDAVDDHNLLEIGRACAGARLITGGSGIAPGLSANLTQSGFIKRKAVSWTAIRGPALCLAGSCSATTLRQVAVYAERHPALAVDVERVVRGDFGVDDALRFLDLHAGAAPLIYTSAMKIEVRRLQGMYGLDQLTQALDAFFAKIAAKALTTGVTRLVIAGGETAGAVVSALGFSALRIGPELDPGIPLLAARHGNIETGLVLKSGNFGGTDLFERAVEGLGGHHAD